MIFTRCRTMEETGLKCLKIFCRGALLRPMPCNASLLSQGNRTDLVAGLNNDLNQVVSISPRSSPLCLLCLLFYIE